MKQSTDKETKSEAPRAPSLSPASASLSRIIFVSGNSGTYGALGLATAVLSEEAGGGPWFVDFIDAEVEFRTHALFGIHDGQTRRVAERGSFLQVAHRPSPLFEGMTPAAAYAKVQKFLRDEVSKDILGRWTAERAGLFLQQNPNLRSLVICGVDGPESVAAVVAAFPDARTYSVNVGLTTREADLPGLGSYHSVMDSDNSGRASMASRLRRAMPELFLELPPTTKIEIAQ